MMLGYIILFLGAGFTNIFDKNKNLATESTPSCSIRRDCRWWQQEGKAACMRCPQVITDIYNPSELAVTVAKLAALETKL